MPLTKKGSRVLRKMRNYYGKKKGTSVFYASVNAKKLKGVEKRSRKR
jgi:hypothetical protein